MSCIHMCVCARARCGADSDAVSNISCPVVLSLVYKNLPMYFLGREKKHVVFLSGSRPRHWASPRICKVTHGYISYLPRARGYGLSLACLYYEYTSYARRTRKNPTSDELVLLQKKNLFFFLYNFFYKYLYFIFVNVVFIFSAFTLVNATQNDHKC